MNPPLELRALRGATTAGDNTCEAIGEAVSELIEALMGPNGLEGSHLLSVIFSVTADLDACFPASIARRRPDWQGVALLDCQQMAVAGRSAPLHSAAGPCLAGSRQGSGPPLPTGSFPVAARPYRAQRLSGPAGHIPRRPLRAAGSAGGVLRI